MSNKKGFTLIELLVVIAIIGVLSSVVLSSLNSARAKGNDAKVKAQLSGLRAAAEVYFDTNGEYGTADGSLSCASTANTMLADTNVRAYLDNMPAGSTAHKCGMLAAGTAYAIATPLTGTGTSGDYWCVDSSGISKAINITTPANVVAADNTCALLDAR